MINWQQSWIQALMAYQGNVAKIRFCPVAGTNNIPAGLPGASNNGWGPLIMLGEITIPTLAAISSTAGCMLNNANVIKILSAAETIVGQGGLFIKPENITHPSQTPMFSDGNWPDAWPNSGTAATGASGLGDILPGIRLIYTPVGGT